MSLLSVEAVTKSYFHNTILNNVSLRLNEGDRLGLIGSNGAGKTTLFRMITGQEAPDSGRIVIAKGLITGYLSQNTDSAGGGDETALVNRELQNMENEMREIEHAIAVCRDHDSDEYRALTRRYTEVSSAFEAKDGYSYERNLKEILTGLELSERAFNTSAQLLSGGEKMRAALAHLLLARPDILLLDEPTNHLDIAAMEWLEEVLLKFKGALIIISHDRYFLDRVCTRTAELQSGSLVVQSGNYSTFMAQKAVEEDFAAKESQRIEREIARQLDIKQTMLSHRNMSGYHMKEKQVEKLTRQLSETRESARREGKARMKFSLLKSEDIRNRDSVVLKAEDLGISFGGETIFSGVSFEVCATDKIVIAGPNGCGKSTLLSVILGNIGDYEGDVSLSPYSSYAFMGQKVFFRDENVRIIDEILSRFECNEGQARSLLARFGFTDTDIHKQLSVLSGGERSRLYMACILEENPEVIFLDEPTNHLDIQSREILENALNRFGGALVSVSHDRYFIEKCAGRVLGFIGKTIREFDSYEAYRLEDRSYRTGAGSDRSSADDPGGSAGSSGQAAARRNRAEERRRSALRRDRLRDLEQKISASEELKISMEQDFGQNTSPGLYKEYSDLLLLIEELYSEYTALSDDEE